MALDFNIGGRKHGQPPRPTDCQAALRKLAHNRQPMNPMAQHQQVCVAQQPHGQTNMDEFRRRQTYSPDIVVPLNPERLFGDVFGDPDREPTSAYDFLDFRMRLPPDVPVPCRTHQAISGKTERLFPRMGRFHLPRGALPAKPSRPEALALHGAPLQQDGPASWYGPLPIQQPGIEQRQGPPNAGAYWNDGWRADEQETGQEGPNPWDADTYKSNDNQDQDRNFTMSRGYMPSTLGSGSPLPGSRESRDRQGSRRASSAETMLEGHGDDSDGRHGCEMRPNFVEDTPQANRSAVDVVLRKTPSTLLDLLQTPLEPDRARSLEHQATDPFHESSPQGSKELQVALAGPADKQAPPDSRLLKATLHPICCRSANTSNIDTSTARELQVPPDLNFYKPVFGSRQERLQAIEYHRRQMSLHYPQTVPDTAVFTYGIEYCPMPDSSIGMEQEMPGYKCKAVIISNLPADTTLRRLLPRVRGGRLLGVTLLRPNKAVRTVTALVCFVDWRRAHAYVQFVHEHGVVQLDSPFHVALAGTPSYPLSGQVEADVARGKTRCLAIRDCAEDQIAALCDSFRSWFDANVVAEDIWRGKGSTLFMLFKGVSHASRARTMIELNPRHADVRDRLYFAKDPCEGPLDELRRPARLAGGGYPSLLDWAVKKPPTPPLDQSPELVSRRLLSLPPTAQLAADHTPIQASPSAEPDMPDVPSTRHVEYVPEWEEATDKSVDDDPDTYRLRGDDDPD